ncbi:hypothetical protein GCK72_018641 [Caenorhabditis remanei]|uniref:CUB-like domain-containing protein n=1 Tax=Caenorhabditis remanei TaxID=31234 RepID=A0A6A5GAB5_CAERE|nr:hypothetical protein GCK72_018641 [Caenorhabditis remanei]KAF1752087.1 hypothetical protein GCK72_018641 [Caenorhabditis remanei]
MIFSFLFCFFVRSASGDAIFECPITFITAESGPIGVIPSNRVGLSVTPAKYDCAYHFLIYPGWALHFSISTHYDQLLGDNITFTDNLGVVHLLPTPNQHIDEWSSAPTAILHIRTLSNTSQMFAIYEFVNVEKKYQQVTIPTGEYLALENMKNRYFTFSSKANDRVALNIAVKNTQDYDTLLEFMFLYDGGDVRNCQMVGRLSNFLRNKKISTSSNVTILNFYDGKSPSYLIANDWSSEKPLLFKSRKIRAFAEVSVFSKYKAILTSKNQQTTGELFDASDQGAAYTWICSDCNSFYWTVLKFHKSTTTVPKAYIELRSLSPTHNTSTLLNYSVSATLDRNFPQLIPSRMFTMINHYSGIAVTLDTSTSKAMTQRWLRPYDGRRGTIFSPSIWDPKTPPNFSFQFEDDNQKFMFGVNVKEVRIAAAGESLTIKTGPTASDNFSYKEFLSDSTDFWTRRESKGNFMQIAYDGLDKRSMAIVSFDI